MNVIDADLSIHSPPANDRLELSPVGRWTIDQLEALETRITAATNLAVNAPKVVLGMSQVQEIDTAGAWLLERLTRECSDRHIEIGLRDLPDRYSGLFAQISRVNRSPREKPAGRNYLRQLELLGQATIALYREAKHFLEMLAVLTLALGHAALAPRAFRLTSAVYHSYRVGWQAMPIILLITFLIGGIIAQQGLFHFRKFGAETYVVDMIGILVLRELGVLIVSIMVAGRSGSAYTAQLGSMKMREEIDALRVMGFDPTEVLILPRSIALIIALPILAFFGSLAALFGGGLVCWLYGGMSPEIYVARLREAVSVTHFEVGMIKAPFMALVIALVACSEGLRVRGSAESLGLQTTNSVVKSIFLVIVLDGLFAVFFASIGM